MSPKSRARGSPVGVWLDETSFALQNDEDEYTQFSLNLGAEPDSGAPSACPTPPRLRLDVAALQRKRKETLEGVCATCLHRVDLAAGGLCPACVAVSPISTTTLSSAPRSLSSGEWEEEDATDYSFAALAQARALQSRRHAPHELSSLLGVRGALVSLARILIGLLFVGVLAASGRWAAQD